MAAGLLLRGVRSTVQKSKSLSIFSFPSISVSHILGRSVSSSSSSAGWTSNFMAIGRVSVCSEIHNTDRIPRQNYRFLSTDTTNTDKSQADGIEQKDTISVTFVDKDGEEQKIKVPIGMSMLEAAHENDIELEGACEGSLACSTCHVIVMDVNYYNKLEDPTDEENDMLDLAFGLTETSRLGCQVIASPELDGIRLALPAATRNFAVDGFVPKPH